LSKNIILVLSVPRSGTTFLCSEIALYQNIRVLYEFFKPVSALNVPNFQHILKNKSLYELPENQKIIEEHIGYMPHKTSLTETEYNHILGDSSSNGLTFLLDKIAADPLGALDRAREIIPEDICIKIHMNHRLPVTDLISRPNVHVVLLQRRDHLARHVSHLKALKTGEWFNTDSSNVKVKVNFEKFNDECRMIDAWFDSIGSQLNSLGKKYLHLYYEDICTNYDRDKFFSIMDDYMCQFDLQLDKRPRTEFLYKKQMNGDIMNSIENISSITKDPS
jgi:LPS sulfotransferase NodH